MSDVKLDIDVINGYLADGKSVAEIREILGISEKPYQKQMKNMGYKYSQKLCKYIKKVPSKNTPGANKKADTDKDYSSNIVVIKEANIDSYDSNTRVTSVDNIENLDLKKMADLIKDYDKIKEVLTWFDSKEYDNSIIEVIPNNKIQIDDNIKNDTDKRRSVQVYDKIWDEFNEFCNKHSEFMKKDLISMALKEYMKKYE